MEVENLERRNLCSVGGHEVALPVKHHHAEVRTLLSEVNHPASGGGAIPLVQIEAAKKARSFTIAQETKFLPGKWRVYYTPAYPFAPGSQAAQEITFTGPERGQDVHLDDWSRSTGLFWSGLLSVLVVGHISNLEQEARPADDHGRVAYRIPR